MGKFNVNGTWIDAPTYAAARQKYAALQPQVAQAVAPQVAPVVVTVAGVLTPRATFLNRSLVRFGIGEVVDLSFTTNPPGRSAASFGGLAWVVTTGNNLIALVNDAGNTGTGHFTCKSQAGTVKLELRTAGNPAQTKISKQFVIVRPSGATMALAAGYNTYHDQGVPSAGFKGAIYLHPNDVSFANTEFRESGANYVGTGIFKRAEVTKQELALSYDTIHPVLGSWVRMNAGDDATTGSMLNGIDTVSTSTSVVGQGTFAWTIPWLVRVVGSTEEIRVAEAVHSVTTDAFGNMTITKAGATLQKNINDPTSAY
jgi:hypothetical protein